MSDKKEATLPVDRRWLPGNARTVRRIEGEGEVFASAPGTAWQFAPRKECTPELLAPRNDHLECETR